MIGRAARRIARTPRVTAVFDAGSVEAALDVLEVMEMAWHDLYDEITPPEPVVDNVLTLSRGDLAALIRSVRLALADPRDLQLAVERGPLPPGEDG